MSMAQDNRGVIHVHPDISATARHGAQKGRK
jgi:hypothetical protein